MNIKKLSFLSGQIVEKELPELFVLTIKQFLQAKDSLIQISETQKSSFSQKQINCRYNLQIQQKNTSSSFIRNKTFPVHLKIEKNNKYNGFQSSNDELKQQIFTGKNIKHNEYMDPQTHVNSAYFIITAKLYLPGIFNDKKYEPSNQQYFSIINQLNQTRNNSGIKYYLNQNQRMFEAQALFLDESDETVNLSSFYKLRFGKQVKTILTKLQEGLIEFICRISENIKYTPTKINKIQSLSIRSGKDAIKIIQRYKVLMQLEIFSRDKSIQFQQGISSQSLLKSLLINPQAINPQPSESCQWQQQYDRIFQKYSGKNLLQSISTNSYKTQDSSTIKQKKVLTPATKKQNLLNSIRQINKQQVQNDLTSNQNPIIKIFTILKKQILNWQPQSGQNNGIVLKLNAEYIINKLSVFKSTNHLIHNNQIKQNSLRQQNQQQQSPNLTTNQQQIINSLLIQKSYNKKIDANINSFKTQVLMLLSIRELSCEYIAQYYFEEIIRKISEINMFYLKLYPKDLQTIIQQNKMKPKNYLLIIKNLTKGLQFLWQNNIVHRDIKPANILLDDRYVPKIIDFGSSSPKFPHKQSFPQYDDWKIDFQLNATMGYFFSYSNFKYLSYSDNITQQQYQMHENVDIYSLAKILELMFNKYEIKKTLGHQISANIDWLIKKCFEPNPYNRPNPEQVNLFFILLCKLWVFQNK